MVTSAIMNDNALSYEEMALFAKFLSGKIRLFYRDRTEAEVEASVCSHGIVSQTLNHATLDPENFKFRLSPLSSTYLVFGENWVLRYLYRLGDYAELPETGFSESLLRSYADNVAPDFYDINQWKQIVVANYWLVVLNDHHKHAQDTLTRLRGRKYVSKTKLATLRHLRDCLAYLMGSVRVHLSQLA